MRVTRARVPRADGDRGSFTLELAILFPTFLLLVLVIVQAALYFFARSIAMSAAQEGARTARLQGHQLTEGQLAATRFATDQGDGVLTNTSVSTTGSTPTQVSVAVTGRVLTVVPGLSLTIRQVAQAPRERYTTAVGPP